MIGKSWEPRKRLVKQKSSGRTVTYFVASYTDETGRRRQRHFRTRREAVAHRRLVDERRGLGQPADEPAPGTIKDVCEQWLDASQAGERVTAPEKVVRKAVVADRRSRLERHVYPVLGGRDVETIAPRDLLIAYTRRLNGRDQIGRGRSGSGAKAGEKPGRREVQLAFQHLRAALAEAAVKGFAPDLGWGALRFAVAEPPREERAPRTSGDDDLPSASTLRRLLETARRLREDPEAVLQEAGALGVRRDGKPDRRAAVQMKEAWKLYYPMILLGVYTGARAGEIRAARRFGVDLESGDFYVTGSADKTGETNAPKTAAGERKIPLPKEVVEVLEQRLKEVDDQPDTLLFSRSGVKAMQLNQFYRYGWNRLFEITGLPRFNFHKLRSYYASWHIDRGTRPNTLKRYMGHDSISTTLDIYVKQLAVSKDYVLDRFSETSGDKRITLALDPGGRYE